QKYWRGDLVELQARPISGPIDPTILRKSAIRSLNGSQPDQCAQRRANLARGEERCCALYEVTRPDQMITSQIVVALGFAPGDTHRRNERALKNFVFMRQQHTTAESIHPAAIGRVRTEVDFRMHN